MRDKTVFKMRKLLFIIIYLSFYIACFRWWKQGDRECFARVYQRKDARIGVAVIINGKDTVSVNGNRDFL